MNLLGIPLMTDSGQLQRMIDPTWLMDIVSRCLKVPVEKIDRKVSLARYGLDSFGAIELTTAVAAKLNYAVPETLLLHYPNVELLEQYIQSILSNEQMAFALTGGLRSPVDEMLADSVLPADIRPHQEFRPNGKVQSILLTGATGFLGAYLLRGLLRETQAVVYCLVRGHDDAPLNRIRKTLQRYGIWNDGFESRLHAIVGDLQSPRLGLPEATWDFLARELDEIYHCGAAVNWVLSYEGLRSSNVLGTRELLRLACDCKPKPFHFVSSLAACYTTLPMEEVSERDEMLAYLGGIHLGYAQSKCVAESLVRRANERGLPATIHRPSLITGDGMTGCSNAEDLLSTMMRGCIEMRSAPNLDWSLDCCAVDYVADAIVGLSHQATNSLQVFHLSNQTRRHWREVVLWMNLFGYSIRLVPYREWLSQLRTSAVFPSHPLYRLRSFFLARPIAESNLTLPELYEEKHRNAVSCERTLQKLSNISLSCPPLNAKLLERYFSAFIESKVLHGVASVKQEQAISQTSLDKNFFEDILGQYYASELLRVQDLTIMQDVSEESITTELSSWQYASQVGLWRYHVRFSDSARNEPKSLELFVKVKPRDQDVLVVAERVAMMCDEKVGKAFGRHKDRLGILGSHQREINVYRQQDPRFRRHVPEVYAAIENEAQREWILVLESLAGMELLNSASDVSDWRPCHIEAAIRGIAQVHSIWFEREQELSAQSWLGPRVSATEMAEMKDLWEPLTNYACEYFTNWVDGSTRSIVEGFVSDVGQWWQLLERMPQTLVHNDFNPRNIAFRNDQGEVRLCAYDWELATLGLPQHDLAELLCFVLPPDCSRESVLEYIHLHRERLSKAAGCSIDADTWQLGFQLAMRDLIMNRFPMYCLIHTFRPQQFLPRIIRTWRRLHDMFDVGLSSH